MFQRALDWLLWLAHRDKGPILIYQMGRVGSTSVQQAILNAQVKAPVYHVHHLSHPEIARLRIVTEKHEARTGKFNHEIRLQFEEAEKIHELMARPESRPHIITMVRDPIARTLSDRIRNAVHFYPHVLDIDGNIQTNLVRDELIETFRRDPEADVLSSWFDIEMKATFGFDVYAHPFANHQGYLRIREKKHAYLVLRLEDLDRIGTKALAAFLRIRPQPFARHEVTPDSKKPVITLPRTVCEGVYSGRLARHFYSDQEIQSFIQKWSDP